MEASYSMVVDRVEQVLERRRRGQGLPTQQEIDDLYTDACATVLFLEAKRSGLERRLAEASAGDSEDAAVVRSSRELARRSVQIDSDLRELRVLVRSLGTAADWARDPASAEAHSFI